MTSHDIVFALRLRRKIGFVSKSCPTERFAQLTKCNRIVVSLDPPYRTDCGQIHPSATCMSSFSRIFEMSLYLKMCGMLRTNFVINISIFELATHCATQPPVHQITDLNR